MESPIPSPAGYRIFEYQVVLCPHEDLWARIEKIRAEFAGKLKLPPPRTTRPHIPLVHFANWAMMEEKLLYRLQTISMGMAPFKVELRDFGSYPSHSIFINIVSKLPVQSVVRELKGAQSLMKLNGEHKPFFIDTPVINIGQKLKPWQYELAWLECSRRHFSGRFIAGSMLLLKRPAGEKVAYQICRHLEFMNLPVHTKQASLFV